ncbi:MAG: serine protease [Verrucomicrobia bacterium]|nr:serine protease [Verrucomicrobiota bacterium]
MVGGSNPSARTLIFLSLWLALPVQTRADSAPPPGVGPVYVLPVQKEIQKGLVYIVRRGVKDAMENKASALVIDMDTPGGEGQAMKEIMAILAKFEPSDRTFTYVNKEAFSAGAFISAATRHIWMAPGAIIGAASPVTLGQEGPKELPPKFVSGFAAVIRAAAEQNGHNPAVFDAMVNKQNGLKIDGREIVAKGDVLTLTTKEATQLVGRPPRTLLADGVADTLEKLVEQHIQPGARIVRVEPTGFEEAGRFIVTISPLLMAAAFLFGYIEFKTPGFGIFGLLAAVCGLIFFFGHYIAGLSGYESLLLVGLGVALLAVELFIFPGTFVPGLLGLGLLLFGLLNTMVDRYPTDPILPTLPQLHLPALNFALGLFGGITAILLAARFLPRTPLFRPFELATTSPRFQPIAEEPAPHGSCGETITDLRPSGRASFHQRVYDVLADGDFIPSGTPVKAVGREGTTTLVRRIDS